jgi:hypothetical protein
MTGYSNGDQVATLTDYSGNGIDATQSTASLRPTYVASAINSKAGINFDGVDDRMASSANITISGAFSCYVILKPNSSSQTQYNRIFEYAGLTGFILCYGSAAITPVYNWSGGGNTGNTLLNYSPTATIAATPFLISYLSDSSKNLSGVARTSSLNASLSLTSTGSLITSSGRVGFGSLDSTGVEGNHIICEVIVYNSKLSSTDDTNVRNYLNGKYSIY